MKKDHIVSISCTSTQRKKSNQHKNKQYTSLSGSLAALSSSLSALKTVENHRKVLITLLNEWLYAGNWSLQNCVFPSDTSVVVESVWLYPSGLITNMVPSHKAKHNKSKWTYFMGEVIPICLQPQKKELCPFFGIISVVLLADFSRNELWRVNRCPTHLWRWNGCPAHF